MCGYVQTVSGCLMHCWSTQFMATCHQCWKNDDRRWLSSTLVVCLFFVVKVCWLRCSFLSLC